MKQVLLLLLLVSVIACGKKKETIHPEIQSITQSVYASGAIKSRNQYQVFANSSGIIEKFFVTEDAIIKEGQPLLQLGNPATRLTEANSKIAADYNAYQNNINKLKELQYNIDVARQTMQNDSLLLARQRNLWQEKIGTKTEVEKRELSYSSSKANYDNALLRYEDARRQLTFAARQSKKQLEIAASQNSEMEVKSQVNGKVFSILKKTGEMVTPQTPIAIVGDTGHYYIELQVDEYDIALITTGQKIFITMDSYKGQVFEAAVTKIYPMMNERSKTFTVEALFTQLPEKMYANLSVEANILITTKDKALLIPRSYLIDDKYVVLASGEKRSVQTGLKDYQKVEILSGVTIQDAIVIPE